MNKDIMDWSTSAYIADTGHLSLAQHGAYVLILMTMWRCGGWIAADEKHLARICRITVKQWRKVAPDIIALLIEKDGQLTQKRVLKEYARFKSTSPNGRLGGIAKSLKTKNPTSKPPGFRQPSATTAAVNALSSLESSKKIPDSDQKVKEVKKARNSRGTTLPDDWAPSASDLGYGTRIGLSKQHVLDMAEDMRLWAKGNANRAIGRKADWTATFQGWMRRQAPKIINGGGNDGTGRKQSQSRGGGGYARIIEGLAASRTGDATAGVRPGDGPDDPGPDVECIQAQRG